MIIGDQRLPPRFWQKVVQSTESTCWLWTGAKTQAGYGQINIKCADGVFRRISVHRMAFEAFVRAIGPAMAIDHLCETKLCVNPSHLEEVTIAENTRRFWVRHPVTHCPAGHDRMTDGSFYIVQRPGGPHRVCKACQAAASAAWYIRKKQARAA